MTTVTVRLFARSRDLAGADFLAVDLPSGATVSDVRRALAERVPALEAFLPRCAIAVNEEFADDSLAVPRDADVALLPPVSGG
ncbi:MAG TPA: MoaD/ThiS family protein [Gemmataceae bacterium]|jgi:molybdopterin converting factor subunit 1|nr:MoaD/ThiS family protein [Gemmataceae bacterium]